MPRVHNMGRAAPIGQTQTTKQGRQGVFGKALQTFGSLMMKQYLQKEDQDAALERELVREGWFETPTDGTAVSGQSNNQAQKANSLVPRNRLMPSPSLGSQTGMGGSKTVTIGGQKYDAVTRTINGKSRTKLVKHVPTFVEKQQYLALQRKKELIDERRYNKEQDAKKRTTELLDRIDKQMYERDVAVEKSIRDTDSEKDVITHRANLGGYKPKTKQDAIDLRKAGKTDINIGAQKFGIQKDVTAGTLRGEIISKKDDKSSYATNAPMFNRLNNNNEVAYWEAKEGKWYQDEGAKVIKLSPKAIGLGWTPKAIQDRAIKTGKTVEEILKKIGVVK